MQSIEKEIKFVLSGSRSGYALSSMAIVKILERKSEYKDIIENFDSTRDYLVSAVKDGKTFYFPFDYLYDNRSDKDLVAVIEELGTNLASYGGSELYIKTVNISIELQNFEGLEKISNIYFDKY